MVNTKSPIREVLIVQLILAPIKVIAMKKIHKILPLMDRTRSMWWSPSLPNTIQHHYTKSLTSLLIYPYWKKDLRNFKMD